MVFEIGEIFYSKSIFYKYRLDIKMEYVEIKDCGYIDRVSQTSFSLYLHNKWTNFHKLSCTGKPQMKVICTYVGGIKATTNDWDIRPSVAIKALSANISWMAGQICMIELVLESAYQSVSNNIWWVSKR